MAERTKLVIGRGQVYFDRFTDGTKTGSGEQYIGNTPQFRVTRSLQQTATATAFDGKRVSQAGITIEDVQSVDFTTDNVSFNNIALWFAAGVDKTATASRAVTESFTVRRGFIYQLGASVDPAGLVGLSNLAVTVRGTTIAEEGNYKFYPGSGRLEILPDSNLIIDGDIVNARFQIESGIRLTANTLNETGAYGALRFISRNVGPEGYTSQTNYFFPYVYITPQGATDLKSDEFQGWSFTARVMQLNPLVPSVYVSKGSIGEDITQGGGSGGGSGSGGGGGGGGSGETVYPATQAEVDEGRDTTKFVNSLTFQGAQRWTQLGATRDETEAGTIDTKYVVPAYLHGSIDKRISDTVPQIVDESVSAAIATQVPPLVEGTATQVVNSLAPGIADKQIAAQVPTMIDTAITDKTPDIADKQIADKVPDMIGDAVPDLIKSYVDTNGIPNEKVNGLEGLLSNKVDRLATSLTASNNLNNYRQGGFYTTAWNTVNNPTNTAASVMVIPTGRSEGACSQIATTLTENETYIRSSFWDTDGALKWFPWRVLGGEYLKPTGYTTSILNTGISGSGVYLGLCIFKNRDVLFSSNSNDLIYYDNATSRGSIITIPGESLNVHDVKLLNNGNAMFCGTRSYLGIFTQSSKTISKVDLTALGLNAGATVYKISVDPSGRAFIVGSHSTIISYRNGTMFKLDADGSSRRTYQAVASDSNGNALVGDAGEAALFRYSLLNDNFERITLTGENRGIREIIFNKNNDALILGDARVAWFYSGVRRETYPINTDNISAGTPIIFRATLGIDGRFYIGVSNGTTWWYNYNTNAFVNIPSGTSQQIRAMGVYPTGEIIIGGGNRMSRLFTPIYQ